MTKEHWNKHIPGDPMPCKCGDSVVEVRFDEIAGSFDCAECWDWGKFDFPDGNEITAWRFIKRKGDDVILDPYDDLEWDGDEAIVVLKKPGQPWWLRGDDMVRFSLNFAFRRVDNWLNPWSNCIAFQIKRRPVLVPAEPQLLKLLSVATNDESNSIRSAARRANIEVDVI